MINLYNPDFLRLYQIDFRQIGIDDMIVLVSLVAVFVVYFFLSEFVFPRQYVALHKKKAERDVRKAMIKREYIEKCEKIL